MYPRRHYTCPIKSKGVIAMLRFSSITRISFLLLPLMVCTPALAALSSPSAQVNQNIIQAREKQSRFLINQSRLTSRISGTDTHPSPLQSMSLQQAEARPVKCEKPASAHAKLFPLPVGVHLRFSDIACRRFPHIFPCPGRIIRFFPG